MLGKRSSRRLTAFLFCTVVVLQYHRQDEESRSSAFSAPNERFAAYGNRLGLGLASSKAQQQHRSVRTERQQAAQAAPDPAAVATAASPMPPLWTIALQGLGLLGAFTGGVAATLGTTAALKCFVGLLGMYVILSFNEYVVHRYYQHLGWNRTPLHRWLRNAFGLENMKTSGHMEHHAETLDDMSLDIKPEPILDQDPFRGTAFSWSVTAKMTLEIALQSYPFLWLCGWSFSASTACLMAGILFHAAVWQTLHPAMHLLPDPPLSYGIPGWSMAKFRKSRYFRFLYANHEGHHRYPGAHGNYNVCFPLADHICGTYRGYIPPAAATA
eukprot:TRINITY_DN41343_c0_g1_i1.p1 TRINITY_DN41343_c0_g1~~TRINITY_DN41343_c0_g1_i1.p1  ORF type:complete len:327 (+),score=47.20 TRINITY_DN41343_c0_g1_i1:75-1055(+)